MIKWKKINYGIPITQLRRSFVNLRISSNKNQKCMEPTSIYTFFLHKYHIQITITTSKLLLDNFLWHSPVKITMEEIYLAARFFPSTYKMRVTHRDIFSFELKKLPNDTFYSKKMKMF